MFVKAGCCKQYFSMYGNQWSQMKRTNLSVLFLVIVWTTVPVDSLIVACIKSDTGPTAPLVCQETSQTINDKTIKWPETESGHEAVSEPLCLDKSLKIITRQCNGDWSEAPNCSNIQQDINPCPSDLNWINERYCYTIIRNTSFPPNCPYPEPLGWDEYVNLGILPSEPVWMPLERIEFLDYGIDVFRYTEITDKYGSPFFICTQSCRTFFYDGTFLDKKCQVYHNSTHVEAVQCGDKYSAVCVYSALTYKKSSLCQQQLPSCKQGSYQPQSICFCETTNQDIGNEVLAEFISPYQNLLFTENSCRIGLQNRVEDTYWNNFIWETSKTPLNYTYWAPNVDFNYKNGTITGEGWKLNDSSPQCSIYQIEPSPSDGQLNLYIEDNSYKLNITNFKSFFSTNNKEPLVYCFTDADAKSIIYRINNFTGETEKAETYIIKFPPINVEQSGPGNYWCQAFHYPNLSIITSEHKIIKNFTAEYVALLRLKNYEERLSSYPLKPENFETLQNLFRNELPNTVSFYPRIFRINRIDEDKKEIDITFHLTSADALNTQDEYETLKNICKAQTMFEFLDFRNVDYCLQDITQHEGQKVIWPQKAFNQTTAPLNGHCVTKNVELVQRTCTGSFTDGVYWTDVSNISCQFYPESSLSDKLIDILSKITDDDYHLNLALTELYEISKSYDSFSTIDFILVTNFIKNVSSKKLNLEVFAGIVSNLMLTSRALLLSAQLNFKATDILLRAIDTVLENGDFGEYREHKQPNFAIKSLDISEGILGFYLQNCSNYTDCSLTPIENSTLLYDANLIITEKVYAAISLSSDLYEQITNYSKEHQSYTPKMIVSVYYGSQLFVELKNAKSSNLVFGVLLPDFPEKFLGPISLYYFTDMNLNLSGYNCSFWRSSEANSGSWKIEETEKNQNAVVCEFDHITNFGTPFIIPSTVTAEKMDKNSNNMHMCIPDDESAKMCFIKKEDHPFCPTIDQRSPFNQFCLTENLTVIPTVCFKNLTTVAPVSDIFQNCTKYAVSPVMRRVLGNVDYNSIKSDMTIDLLLSLTASPENLTETDLLFVALFLSKIPIRPMDMTGFVGIVNNLMKVPKSVLYNAQKNFNAIDILPSLVENVLVSSQCKEWKTEKFALKCMEISDNNKAVLLENCTEDFTDCDFRAEQYYNESLASNDASYALVILSDELFNQIMDYKKSNSNYIPKLIISVYYGTQLFVDKKTDSSLCKTVFGLSLPDFNTPFRGPILIYYFKGADYSEYSCSYWKVDENANGSWVVEYISIRSSLTLCKYYHLSHFAIDTALQNKSYKAKIGNKTHCSARPLGNYLCAADFNKQIYFVSDHCNINEYFANIFNQIYIYGEIIFNCSSGTAASNILNEKYFTYRHGELKNTRCYSGYRRSTDDSYLSIFHNRAIHKSNSIDNKENLREISRESENVNATEQANDIKKVLSPNELIFDELFSTAEHAAPLGVTLELLANTIDLLEDTGQDLILENADLILYRVDTILAKYTGTNMVRNENVVFVTVSQKNIKHFQGFSITRTGDILCIFQKDYFRDQENDIDLDVVISPELQLQIQEANSTIMFAIFYNALLFPSVEKHRVRLPVIEVLIPDVYDELKGDITIKYKNRLHGKCSYWENEISENKVNVSGYWRQESNAEVVDDSTVCSFRHVTHFSLVATSQNVTNDLQEIITSNLSSLEKLKQVDSITTLNYANLVCMDIYLISQIITNSLSKDHIPKVVTRIVSTLFMVSREVLREAQQVHSSTDIILYAVDEMSRKMDDFESHHQNFSLIVKSLNSTNLTGLLLHSCENYLCAIDKLTYSMNISDYSNNNNISAMVIFSEELLCQIRNNSDTKVALAIYYSDILFNERNLKRETTLIFGVVLPGLTDVLTGPVSVVYNMGSSTANDHNQCAYWHYKPDPTGNLENATLGEWMKDNNKTRQDKLAICTYSHVTHFGMLLANDDDYDDDTVLDLITDIGCVLSLFGIIVILVTALLFKKWRQNTGNQLLINFSIAISIKITTLYVSVYIKNNSSGIICTITGIILHYATLSECNWMLTVAILQFKRFVEVLSRPPKYVLVKALICGWIFPIIPVLCVIVIDPHNYEHGFANLCYPSNLGLYLGIWLPVLIILTINCVIFIFIIYNVFHKKTEFIDRTNHEILFQWRLAFLLFFMLGLNWAFGFLGQIKGDILFIYLYSITASLQGFVLFLFFIVFNKGTRFLYSHCIKQWFYARGIFKVWQ